MTRKAQTYLTRIKAAGSIYDLQGVEIAFKQDCTLGWDDIDHLCKAADGKRYTLTNSEDTIRLKNLLFFRVKAEMDAYHDMSHAPESNTAEEIQRQRARFCSVWQVLEEAELVDEYDAWKCAGSIGNGQNPEKLKGCFAFKPSTVNDLRTAQSKEEKKPIRVAATEWLKESEFESFLQNLLMDHPFILRHTSELCYRDGTMHCLLVRCEGKREAVAVEPEGYGYARYAALVTVE